MRRVLRVVGLPAMVAAASVYAAATLWPGPAAKGAAPQRTPPRHLRLENVLIAVRVRSLLSEPVRRLTIRLPVPRTNEYQIIERVWTAPKPAEHDRGEFGSEIVFFDYRNVPPGGVRWAFMLVRCRPRPFEPERRENFLPVPWEIRQRCLGKSDGVDPTAPEILREAERFRKEYNSRWEQVRAINRWIVDEFTYVLDDRQVPASETLRTRCGSCSELSRLFVAVARACGIPARFTAGSRLRSKQRPYVDAVHHRWIEVFLPYYGWFPIDVSANVQTHDPEKAFGRTSGGRLVLCRNAGVPNHPFHANSYVLTYPASGIECRLRSYWLGPHTGLVRDMLDLLRRGMTSRRAVARIRRAVQQMKPEYAIPFRAMALYEPIAKGDPTWAIGGLARTKLRAAVVPLIDFLPLAREDATRSAAIRALEELTTLHLDGAETWKQWLLSPSGLGFLAGKPPAPPASWTSLRPSEKRAGEIEGESPAAPDGTTKTVPEREARQNEAAQASGGPLPASGTLRKQQPQAQPAVDGDGAVETPERLQPVPGGG